MRAPNDYPISIGSLSKRTDCKVETIRYYEQQELLPQPPRTPGGHRLYSEALTHRLMFIRRSRELGFSMDEVRQLLSLVDRKQISCERVKSLTEAHLQDIDSKINDLQKMRRSLSSLARKCSGKDVPDCPIIDDLQSER